MKKLILLLLILLTSCHGSKYIEVPVEVPIETIKTEYINKIHYDSIYIYDNTDRYISNDTVFITRNKYINKYILDVDTVLKINSIDRPVYIPKYVDREVIKYTNKLTWFLKIFMYFGLFTLGGILIGLAAKLKCKI